MSSMRVVNRFFAIRDFPYFGLGIRDSKAKSGRDSGLKICSEGGMLTITLGIMDSLKFLVGITGLKTPIGDPLQW